MSEKLWLVINTLETITIPATEDNVSKMTAVLQTLKNMAKQIDEEVKDDGK